jgi:HemY protein
MMRYGVWALAALVLGAFGAHFLMADRGYVLISFVGYSIEMSVPVLALALVLLYVGVRLLLRLWRAPKQLGEALARQRDRRAGSRLTEGLIRMTEGDFRRSERLLTDGLASSDSRVVNYLMAARAAEAQGSPERRDQWLGLARDADPKAEIAVLLTQAELQVKAAEYRAALATLAVIDDRKPGHAGGLALAVETALALGDRQLLASLLPRLAKAKLDPDRLATLLARALEALRGDPAFGRGALQAVWSPLPIGVRRRPELIRTRALLLDRLGHGDEAVKALTQALNRDFERELILAYGEVRAADPARQLRRAEDWLRQSPENAALLTTTARLCMNSELWGKARSYLETSLAIAPEPATYALYGQLLDRLGERDEAARAYQSGLRMVTPDVGALPALAAPWSAEAADAREADG